MPAYVVNHLELLDEAAASAYRPLAEASVREFGGRYLARGAEAGEHTGTRVVIIEFDNLATALDWWHSQAYAQALALRDGAMRCTMVIVDGLAHAARG